MTNKADHIESTQLAAIILEMIELATQGKMNTEAKIIVINFLEEFMNEQISNREIAW